MNQSPVSVGLPNPGINQHRLSPLSESHLLQTHFAVYQATLLQAVQPGNQLSADRGNRHWLEPTAAYNPIRQIQSRNEATDEDQTLTVDAAGVRHNDRRTTQLATTVDKRLQLAQSRFQGLTRMIQDFQHAL
jgi:hypothetical protein